MDIKTLTKDLSVSPQIQPADMNAIAKAGFRSVLCNRPDGEAPDQPPFAAVREAAQKAGLEARYLPVVPGEIGPADGQDFARALSELPAPVLAFCRTGNRSASLWELAQRADT